MITRSSRRPNWTWPGSRPACPSRSCSGTPRAPSATWSTTGRRRSSPPAASGSFTSSTSPPVDFGRGVIVAHDKHRIRVMEADPAAGSSSPLVVEIDGTVVGLIEFAPVPRLEAASAIERIRKLTHVPFALVSSRGEAEVGRPGEVARRGDVPGELLDRRHGKVPGRMSGTGAQDRVRRRLSDPSQAQRPGPMSRSRSTARRSLTRTPPGS